jgi:hypothetical protein
MGPPAAQAIAAFLKTHSKVAADVEKSHNALLVDRIVGNHLILEDVPAALKDGTYTSVSRGKLVVKGSAITGPQARTRAPGRD